MTKQIGLKKWFYKETDDSAFFLQYTALMLLVLIAQLVCGSVVLSKLRDHHFYAENTGLVLKAGAHTSVYELINSRDFAKTYKEVGV